MSKKTDKYFGQTLEAPAEKATAVDPVVAMKDQVEAELVSHDQSAFSVVRVGGLYKLIRIPFSKTELKAGKPEIELESTDRWEVQSQFNYHCDQDFLDVEELEK